MTAQEITLDTVIGLAGADTLDVGVPIEFRLRVSNSSGDNYYGATNGFRIYSTTGATWYQHIYYDTTIVQFPSVDTIVDTTYYGRWADNIYIDSIWDGGHFVNFYSDHDDSALTPDLFGQGSDTIGFGGYQQAKWGLYNTFDEIMFTIKLDSISTLSGRKTLCLDSAFYRPSGYWRWSDPDTIPSWDGPHCFAIKRNLIQEGGESLGGGGGEEEQSLYKPGELEFATQIALARERLNSPESGSFYVDNTLSNVRLVRADRSKKGMTHVRFQQVHNGLDVYAREVVAHFHASGELWRFTGRYARNLDALEAPTVSAYDAESTALSAALAKFSTPTITDIQEIVYVDGQDACYAWLIDGVDEFDMANWSAVVDRRTGNTLVLGSQRQQFPSVGDCTMAAGQGHHYNPEQITASYDTVSASDTTWVLRDRTRVTWPLPECEGFAEGKMLSSSSILVTVDTLSTPPYHNVSGIPASAASESGDTAYFGNDYLSRSAIDAYYYSGITYDWLLSEFNWNSWDNEGGTVWAVILPPDSTSVWCGGCRVQYHGDLYAWQIVCSGPCDSVRVYPGPASPDVMAHEWCHLVQIHENKIHSTGPEEHQALIEAFALCMQEAFKIQNVISFDDSILWRPGRMMYDSLSAYDCAWYLPDPHDDRAEFKAAAYYDSTGPCADSLYYEGAGGPQLQGIPQKWFHLLAEGTNPPCASKEFDPGDAIGIDGAAEVLWDAQVYYWYQDIEFVDAAKLSASAALLLDYPSLELAKSVVRAWWAVGVLDTLDSDTDGAWDAFDNCLGTYNPSQLDADADGLGDACDTCIDRDGDGYPDPGYGTEGCAHDSTDGCPDIYDCLSPVDPDGDGLWDPCDNCDSVENPSQSDYDDDDIGDSCDYCNDLDTDGYGDPGFPSDSCSIDNCPMINNPSQTDSDSDGLGDACDPCPGDSTNLCDCCAGSRGNVDFDPNDQVTIADLTYLVGWMFKGAASPICIEEADVNGDQTSDISDLTYLVSYMFKSGQAPASCSN